MAAASLKNLQRPRSRDAIFDFRVRPDHEGNTLVEFKAKQGAFSPSLLDGAECVFVRGAEEREMRGRLRVVGKSHSRGMWFGYRFLPEPSLQANNAVAFTGLCHWSDVKFVDVFVDEGIIWRFTNSFFRV